MLIIQNNKTYPQQSNVAEVVDHDLNFKQALYRNSKVDRLIVHDYLKQSVLTLSSWYTISLQLVNEMGLPAQTGLFKTNKVLPLTCQLLELNTSERVPCYTSPSNLQVECAYYEENDTWRQFDDIKNRALNNIITLQYRIAATDRKIPKHVFIHFQPTTTNNYENGGDNKLLDLCLGPFQLIDSGIAQSPLTMWDDSNRNSINLYRVMPLPKDGTHCLFQEVWDNGTSGKLWDSALVMNQVFTTLIQYDNNFLSGLRILDLSAGIGYVGLSIETICRLYKTKNPPEIVLTDLQEALPLMRCNQRLNRIPHSSNLSFRQLRWGSKKDIKQVCKKPFDYILVLDVLYNVKDFSALIDTFCQLVNRNENVTIIMGYKPRGLLPSEENLFFSQCKIFLHMEQLSLESICKQFIGNLSKISQNTILEDTAVCFYRITKLSK